MPKKKEAFYVVNSACVQCSRGNAVTSLNVPNRAKIGNNWVVTARDTGPKAFAGNFGTCRRTGKACTLATLPEWFRPAEKVLVGTWAPETVEYEKLLSQGVGGTQSTIHQYLTLPESIKNVVPDRIKAQTEKQVQKTRALRSDSYWSMERGRSRSCCGSTGWH